MKFHDFLIPKQAFRRWLLFSLLAVTAAALQAPLPPPWPQLLAFLLVFVWPMWGWVGRLAGSIGERVVLSAALVMALDVILVLLLSYLPGPMIRPYQLIAHILLALLPLIGSPKIKLETAVKPAGAFVLFLLLLTIGLRISNLGYSEFQGDEGVIIARAAAIISGDETEIFLHQKGPAEILLPLTLWNTAGSINEFWARLPFAWAGILAVFAVALLARRWFDWRAGIWAGLFLAISGFAVAFSRIVQYQSLVMVWGTLAVLAAIRYTADRRRIDLWLTAVFLGTGLLAHYDAVLVLPAVGWTLIRPIWQSRRFDWRAWGSAFVWGVFILAIFYIPYANNPNIGRTGRYLIQGRLGAGNGHGLLSWSGPAVWQMITFYNSLYYAAGLILSLVPAGWFLWRRRTGLAAVLLFIVPLLFYLFIVADPRTHVYTIFPGAAILAAVGSVYLWPKVARGNGRYAFLIISAALLLVSTAYTYLLFVDNTPERQRNWAEARPTGYPTTWREPPLYGLFGFPHQAGWRAVKDILPVDAYPYAGNEEKEITNIYMEQSPRTHCANFATFILAENAQDEVPYDPAWLDDLFLQTRVLVNGRPSLQIYGRQSVQNVTTIEASDKTIWLTPPSIVPAKRTGAYPVNSVLGGGQVKLLGFDVDNLHQEPGGQIVVTLYWEALAPLPRNYQTFVHLYDGRLLAQHDGAPECNINPTTRWEPGQVIADPHILTIPLDSEVGTPSLLAGMYDLVTGDRLTVLNSPDNLIVLTEVEIITDRD